MPETASRSFAVIPFAALVLLGLLVTGLATLAASRRTDRNERFANLAAIACRLCTVPGTVLWTLPFVGLLLFLGVWIASGLVGQGCGLLTVSAYSLAMLAFAVITLVRKPLFSWTERLGMPAAHLVGVVRDLVILSVVALLSAWSIEYAWNESFLDIPVLYFGFSALAIFGVELFLYFLGQRTGALACLAPIACAVLGIAQHFVLTFKGAAILPSDLLALKTAAAVSAGYTYTFTETMVQALAIMGFSICLLSLVQPLGMGKARARGTAGNIAGNLCAAALVAGLLAGAYNAVSMEDDLGLSYDRWMPITTYQADGFIPSFVALCQDFAIDEPEGYSDEAATRTQAALAASYDAGYGASAARAEAVTQFEEVQPAVIAVMNESFTDLSVFPELAAEGYAGPAFYNSLGDTLQRGTLMVTPVAGGTANSEFEFLTGDSVSFIGATKYPYQLYDMSEVGNLARQFDELGYATTAMHPNLAGNWNRDTVYGQFGFDEFLSIEDFEGAPGYHAGVTDRATYDKILELLRGNEEPQFIFDVTMQNHSGYEAGTVPDEDMTSFAPPGVADEDVLTQLNVYLACVEASDRDLEYFIGELEQLDRPVVLVFFGDHISRAGTGLSEALYGEAADPWRLHESTYLIWANYDVAGNDQVGERVETSTNFLGAQLLNAIGAPLTDYQKALVAANGQIPSLNALGYRGADGLRYDLTVESPYAQAARDLEAIQYLNFARKIQ